MESEEIKKTVAAGYNRLGERFAAWAESVRVEERRRYLQVILDRVAPGEPILELGCGHGGLSTRTLAARYRLTGIDLAGNLLALAQKESPQARFICADMADYIFPPNHFAGIVAFYSLFHLPRVELPAMIRKIHETLKAGGLFAGALGVGNHEPVKESDFLGVEMVSSSYDPATNVRLFAEAGFSVEMQRVETEKEFGREIAFQWIVASKA